VGNGKRPCGVCGRGVGNNSMKCTSCPKWVQGKCSGIKGRMYKVMKTCICRGCVNPVTGTGRTSVDIGVNANLELVEKFCYLGDMLSVDGDGNAAVENRIRVGWNKLHRLTEQDSRLAHYFELFWDMGPSLGYLASSGAKYDVVYLPGDSDFL